jgi:hypothetical protein
MVAVLVNSSRLLVVILIIMVVSSSSSLATTTEAGGDTSQEEPLPLLLPAVMQFKVRVTSGNGSLGGGVGAVASDFYYGPVGTIVEPFLKSFEVEVHCVPAVGALGRFGVCPPSAIMLDTSIT